MLNTILSGDDAIERHPFVEISDVEVVVDGLRYLVSASVELPGCWGVHFTAWEPSSVMGNHATISAGRGRVWGAVRSLRTSDEELPLARFPYGSAVRIDAVDTHTREQEARAVRAIQAAHPWVEQLGGETNGDVVVMTADVPVEVLS